MIFLKRPNYPYTLLFLLVPRENRCSIILWLSLVYVCQSIFYPHQTVFPNTLFLSALTCITKSTTFTTIPSFLSISSNEFVSRHQNPIQLPLLMPTIAAISPIWVHGVRCWSWVFASLSSVSSLEYPLLLHIATKEVSIAVNFVVFVSLKFEILIPLIFNCPYFYWVIVPKMNNWIMYAKINNWNVYLIHLYFVLFVVGGWDVLKFYYGQENLFIFSPLI